MGKVLEGKALEAAQAAVAAAGRVEAGAPVLVSEKPERVLTLGLSSEAPVRGSGRRFTRHWFLQRNDDLAVVTDEASNETLGITDIQIQAPTLNMKKSGIICKVALVSTTGWDYGISIWESKEIPGDIMLMVGGAREITKPATETSATGVPAKRDFIRDRRFNDATTAQILSFVWKHLTAINPAPMQPAAE